MTRFSLILIGTPQPILADIDVNGIDELRQRLARTRFLEVRLVQNAECSTEICALLQINRIQSICEVLQ
jgi:hypothetical protein